MIVEMTAETVIAKGIYHPLSYVKVIENYKNRSRDDERERYHSSSATKASSNARSSSSNSRGANVFHFAGTPGATIKKTPVITADKKDVKTTKSTYLSKEEKKIMDVELDNEYAAFEWEEFDKEADRDWYDQDENGVIEDSDAHFIGDRERFRLIEEQMDAYNSRTNRTLKSGQNLKEKEKDDEHNKWELNRMLTSGIFKFNDIKVDFNEDEDSRVILMVHDIKPPFLSGRDVSTTKEEIIQVVKDPTSDFAILAKKGSAVLKSVREKNDR